MPSFDAVSEVDTHELTNALDQTNREISNRYDFRGSDAKVAQEDSALRIEAQSEFQIDQIYDILTQKMAKRRVDVGCLERGQVEEANLRARQVVAVRQGIDQAIAKKMIKIVKDSKIKVQTAIQGDKVRVSGKKRDDLQKVMSLLRDAKLGIPVQFENFRD